MPGLSDGSSWNSENEDSAFWMLYLMHVDSESESVEKLTGSFRYSRKGPCADDGSKSVGGVELVPYTKNEHASALIRDCYAILAKLLVVVAVSGGFEFNVRRLGL